MASKMNWTDFMYTWAGPYHGALWLLLRSRNKY